MLLPDFCLRYTALAGVSRDFHDTARRIMEIIISELATLEGQKTFLPINSGEQLLTVYDVQNVIYKVAHGGQGSQSWKELGNELRHNLNLYRCRVTAVCTPLMCVFDYKGFRVLAYAKLPQMDKMVLGWDRTLKGYISEMADLHQRLQASSITLNLKLHHIGVGELSVQSFLNASAVAFLPVDKSNSSRSKKQRVYVTNLKHLFPTDLTRGGMYNPEDFNPDVSNSFLFCFAILEILILERTRLSVTLCHISYSDPHVRSIRV